MEQPIFRSGQTLEIAQGALAVRVAAQAIVGFGSTAEVV
jgi:hypothetical protein